MYRHRSIRVFVRNKSRYNPEAKEREFLHVHVNDFAGTTIGDIKEAVRCQCHNTLKIDELFRNNVSLADDRSVAHYNLEDQCILETTSNPFLVSCLYIKACEVKQLREGNPADDPIQKWTERSYYKKYILIGILLNSKNDKAGQPPHFPALDDFLAYLEVLNKKGATMHPEYTQRDMRAFEREYREEFIGRYSDPLATFIDHHAVRLGLLLPDELDQGPAPIGTVPQPPNIGRLPGPAGAPTRNKQAGKKKQVRHCEDCEQSVAEVFCQQCQGGLAMCRYCAGLLHAGASRRGHILQDIEQAPNNNAKPYIPRAFLTPFAIVLAMFGAMSENLPILSLTETDIKARAQRLTDTDLQDKQAGKYVGGFDCMENVLIVKGLVKKEASRTPTYALTALGQVLGERLYIFYTSFNNFLASVRLPRLNNTLRHRTVGGRRLVLLIDENERDRARLSQLAAEKGLDTQVRMLPAGDYIWILSPPQDNTGPSYTDTDSHNELVLPYVVERKSWEDFENSVNSTRFKRQVNAMLGCGLVNCFYLMEGHITALRNSPTSHQQERLKAILEQLTVESGFYVNYTSSWMKSAQWLMWFSALLGDGLARGQDEDSCISYAEYLSRTARRRNTTNQNTGFKAAEKHSHVWRAQNFIDHIVRFGNEERAMLTAVQTDLSLTRSPRHRHLLVLHDLEQYNKRRQSMLTKCCEAVYHNPNQADEIVSDRIGQAVHNMVHYDLASYWQLTIQLRLGVYVVRTENLQVTERIQRLFLGSHAADNLPGLPDMMPEEPQPNSGPAKRKPSRSKAKARNPAATSRNPGHPIEAVDPIPQLQHLIHAHGNPTDKHSDHTNDTDLIGAVRNHDTLRHSINEKGDNSDQSLAGHVIKTGHKRNISGGSHSNTQGQGKRGVNMADIQPFSGHGYSLGTGNGNKSVSFVNNGLGLNNDKNRLSFQESDKFKGHITERSAGLIGGMRREERDIIVNGSRNDSDMNAEPVVGDMEQYLGHEKRDTLAHEEDLKPEDFIDSQNEDLIMSEVLAKSATENLALSNEEEMMRLAMEMSRRQSSTPSSARMIDSDSKSINQLTEEEQLEMALKESARSISNRTHQHQDSLRSHAGTLGQKTRLESVDNLTEDEQFQLMLERSRHESGEKRNAGNNQPCRPIFDNLLPSVCSSESASKENELVENEDEDIKLAIELSKRETPRKNNLIIIDDDSQKDESTVKRKATKRRHFDDNHNYDVGSVGDSAGRDRPIEKESQEVLDLTEDEQLKSAIALSLSQIPKQGSDKQAGLVVDLERAEKLTEEEELRLVLEKSKTDHSPRKKVKIGGQNLCLDEDDMVKLAIEKSIIEHSPVKKHRQNFTSKKDKTYESLVSVTDLKDGFNNVEVIEINSQNSQELENDGVDIIDGISSSTGSFSVGTETVGKGVPELDKVSSSLGLENIELLDSNESDCVAPSPAKSSELTLSLSHIGNNSTLSQNSIKTNSAIFSHTVHEKDALNENSESQLSNSWTGTQGSKGLKVSESLLKIMSPNLISVQKSRKFDLKSSLFYDSDESNDDDDEEEEEEAGIDKLKAESEPDIFENDDDSSNDNNDGRRRGHAELVEKIDKTDDKNEEVQSAGIDQYVDIKPEVLDIKQENEFEVEKRDWDHSDTVHDIKQEPSDYTRVHQNDQDGIDSFVKEEETEYSVDSQSDYCGVDFTFDDDCNDDDDRDKDYKPSKKDLVSSDDDDCNDGDDDDDDDDRLNLASQSSMLPTIRRPRSIKYRELKRQGELLLDERRNEILKKNTLNAVPSTVSKHCVKKESVVDDEGEGRCVLDMDAEMAKEMQEQFDREAREREREKSLVDDEYVARQLHEAINSGVEGDSDVLHNSIVQGQNSRNNTEISGRENVEYISLDENTNSYRGKTSSTVNQSSDQQHIRHGPLSSKERSGRICTNEHVYNTDSVQSLERPLDPAVLALQRRELAKIQRWRQMIETDAELARRLQAMQEDGPGQDTSGTGPSTSTAPSSIASPANLSFKKLIAQHKVSREKAIAQLQEYRRLQMERFAGQTRGGDRPAHRSRREDDHGYGQDDHINSAIDHLPGASFDPLIDLVREERPAHTPQRLSNSTNQTVPTPTQNATVPFPPKIQTSQSDDGVDDHMVQTNQSAAGSPGVKNSNIKCGNCGGKGHNRTFPRCPKYHTAEESARREAKQEKIKQQREEKKRQEVETINLLSEHRDVLEQMTAQIQTEMSAIQRRLQQRASELETQVNTRVRHMRGRGGKRK